MSPRVATDPALIESLRASAPAILPSLLLCDFGNLEREIRRLEEAGVPALHLDVMDGDFVPNFTYGMTIVAAIRKLTRLPLDVHLMISQPARYLRQFREAGADAITFHIEAAPQPRPLLEEIHRLGALAGIVLNPQTPVSAIADCLDLCDIVLAMSVQAGFGGQKFNPVALDKLREIRALAPHVLLEIDGGVNQDTVHLCAAAGAQLLVVGSALFSQPDYGAAVKKLRALAQSS
jgi:ribulose-phosphate 3-epimerase